ncbi:MAG: 4Fe-4S binding protein [Clostridiales bacterium]|nr:4Fe-4S binding protein [Clostridiales bacterium]
MMEQKPLGKTEIMVSPLAFGTLTISPLQQNFPPEKGRDLILYAASKGITLFDTAQLYQTYDALRLALEKNPAIQVATKSYAWDQKHAQIAFDEARKALNKDHIELFLLHEQESIHTMRGHREAFEFFLSQKAKGNIGAVGMSTHRVAVVDYGPRYPGLDVLHPLINYRGIGIADGTRAEMEQACAKAHLSGIGIYGMKALGGGHLLQEVDQAIAYVRGLPFMDTVALGMQSQAEIDVNVALFSDKEPPQKALEEAKKAPRKLLIHDWCLGCGNCVQRCGQKALTIKNGRAVVDYTRCVRCGYCVTACPEFCIKVV